MSRLKDIWRQTGYSASSIRSPEDYYITPSIAVTELLKREKFSGQGWEPACGNGAISKYFTGILASDIRSDNIAGEPNIDFLHTYRKVDFIITNPPFKLLLPFMQHAIKCAKRKIAIFCRLQALEGKARYHFYTQYPPTRIYIFSDRVSCVATHYNKNAHAIMCFCWMIWDIGSISKPVVDWILTERKSNADY